MTIPRAHFLSKGKEKMHNLSKDVDETGIKGFVGCSHRGSSVTVFPYFPATSEKWLNFGGYCGTTTLENSEVFSYQFSQPSMPFLSPFSGLALPYPSPFVPDLSTSAFQS